MSAIQKVHLELVPRSETFPEACRIMFAYFAGSDIICDSCEIVLDLTCFDTSSPSRKVLYVGLRTLTNFKRVTMGAFTRYVGSWDEFSPPTCDVTDILGELKPALGPAIVKHCQDYEFFEFRPLDFIQAKETEHAKDSLDISRFVAW